MTPFDWALLIIAIIAIALAVVFGLKMRSRKLRSRFGPEYDRLVEERGSTLKAESELEQRAKRVEKLQIRPLTNPERDQYMREWRSAQEQFVDDPRNAVAQADMLVQRAMKAKGYPAGTEFDDRAAYLSVDHPVMVENYRAAHVITTRDGRTAVSTEDLRIAMKHYHTLFEDLLGQRVEEITGRRITGVLR